MNTEAFSWYAAADVIRSTLPREDNYVRVEIPTVATIKSTIFWAATTCNSKCTRTGTYLHGVTTQKIVLLIVEDLKSNSHPLCGSYSTQRPRSRIKKAMLLCPLWYVSGPVFCFLLVSCLVYSSTLKMEAIRSSRTLVHIYRTTWHYNTEARTL
jgi:hypothetical protein